MKKLFVLAAVLALMCSCDAIVPTTCSKCGGSGKCQNCGGDGIVYLVVKCGECGGSGKCQSCNGRGYAADMNKPGAKDKSLRLELCGIKRD
jgi:hypothetical protein